MIDILKNIINRKEIDENMRGWYEANDLSLPKNKKIKLNPAFKSSKRDREFTRKFNQDLGKCQESIKQRAEYNANPKNFGYLPFHGSMDPSNRVRFKRGLNGFVTNPPEKFTECSEVPPFIKMVPVYFKGGYVLAVKVLDKEEGEIDEWYESVGKERLDMFRPIQDISVMGTVESLEAKPDRGCYFNVDNETFWNLIKDSLDKRSLEHILKEKGF